MAGTGMIRLLDPTVKPKAKELKMAPRPENLAGKRIGVAWNHFPNGDALLDRLYELLNKQFHFSETVTHMKPQASSGMDDDALKKLTKGCDFIIIAVGDWGSCTSYVIRDAVELEKRGVPVTAIITDEFLSKGREEARAAGMPDLAVVSVPHPIAGISRAEVANRADVILEEMADVMTMPREKLHERAERQAR